MLGRIDRETQCIRDVFYLCIVIGRENRNSVSQYCQMDIAKEKTRIISNPRIKSEGNSIKNWTEGKKKKEKINSSECDISFVTTAAFPFLFAL